MLCYGVISLIYVPDLENYDCYVVQSENTLRAYEDIPQPNTTIRYRDYYLNSSYIYRDGKQTFSNYATNIPICLSDNVLTDSVYYRNDFDSIMVITFILLIICFYFPFRIISRMFGRWLKF